MADLREQLNAIADRLDHLDGHDVDESEELEWAVKQMKTLAAQPAPAGEVALPERKCDGCPHLCTERWLDYLDNDETDSGTLAKCMHSLPAKTIDTYWAAHHASPAWCPLSADARAAAAASRPATAVPEGLIVAARRLAFAARTCGGTAGRDAELCAALDAIEPMLSAAPQPAGFQNAADTGAPSAQQPLDESAKNAGVATGSRNDSPCESVTRGSPYPQPAAVKQDLTTAQEDPCPNCTPGVVCKTPKCGRLAARMRDLAAAEQASYVGAGAHGIADEPEAKAGADVEKKSCAFSHCAYRKEGGCKGGCFALSQPKPAEGGAVAWQVTCKKPGAGPTTYRCWSRDEVVEAKRRAGVEGYTDEQITVRPLVYGDEPAAATRAEDAIYAMSRMKDRVIEAHRLCFEAMQLHPNVPELGDDGELHKAIHAIVGVDTPLYVERAEEVEAKPMDRFMSDFDEPELRDFASRLAGKGAPHG